MRARVSIRRTVPIVLAAAWIAAGVGCGAKYPLPTEAGKRVIPSDGSYQMLKTFVGANGIRDLLLTQGGGSQLYALFNYGGSGAAPRGEVYEISRTGGNRISPSFPGLFVPVALSSGGDAAGNSSNRVYVLDQGDTCLARTNPATGLCDSTGRWGSRMTHPELYWKVVEYDRLGAEKSAFSDSSLAYVNGIASDDKGDVYVAGVAVIKLPTTDPRLVERVFEHRVWRYQRGLRSDGTADPTVFYPDPARTSPWHRDTNYELRQGTGVGAVIEARGMYWSPNTGSALFVADLGNFRVEKVRDGNADLPDEDYYHTPDIPDAPALQEPLDVVVDLNGFFYVADATGQQVLRFDDATRTYVQRVDVEKDQFGQPLDRPVTVAADIDYVFVGDAGRGEIIRYLRRK